MLGTGVLNLQSLDRAYVAVIQLRHQPGGVIHSVALRPDKVVRTSFNCSCGSPRDTALIRLGESPGDEVHGWQHPENINVIAVLGWAEIEEGKKTTVVPMVEVV